MQPEIFISVLVLVAKDRIKPLLTKETYIKSGVGKDECMCKNADSFFLFSV